MAHQSECLVKEMSVSTKPNCPTTCLPWDA